MISELCRYDPYHPIDYGLRESEVLQNNITREAAPSPLPPTSISAAFSLPASLLQPPLLASMPPLIQPVNIPQTFPNSTSAGNHFLILILIQYFLTLFIRSMGILIHFIDLLYKILYL